ncbi:hypothetical protein OsJ_24868 [Oryza sativa Japonica Group]|uniref:Uncharacterized protein n=1 Tax=Oryza sativa subsp. japonica TaxID=39947 RepID=B9FY30_ORYSJ|nr:hypothetical protein OsJ_24868 [Oryza sativa Japonica Group]
MMRPPPPPSAPPPSPPRAVFPSARCCLPSPHRFLPSTRRKRLVTVAKLAFPAELKAHTLHLVDNGGELMLVHHCFGTTRRDDEAFSPKRTVSCRGLGVRRRAAFLGRNRTLSVSAERFSVIAMKKQLQDEIQQHEEAHAGAGLEAWKWKGRPRGARAVNSKYHGLEWAM